MSFFLKLFNVCCLLLVDYCLLIFDCCLLSGACCFMLALCCLLIIICCLPFQLSDNTNSFRSKNTIFRYLLLYIHVHTPYDPYMYILVLATQKPQWYLIYITDHRTKKIFSYPSIQQESNFCICYCSQIIYRMGKKCEIKFFLFRFYF